MSDPINFVSRDIVLIEDIGRVGVSANDARHLEPPDHRADEHRSEPASDEEVTRATPLGANKSRPDESARDRVVNEQWPVVVVLVVMSQIIKDHLVRNEDRSTNKHIRGAVMLAKPTQSTRIAYLSSLPLHGLSPTAWNNF